MDISQLFFGEKWLKAAQTVQELISFASVITQVIVEVIDHEKYCKQEIF